MVQSGSHISIAVKCENVALDAYHQRQTLVFSLSLIHGIVVWLDFEDVQRVGPADCGCLGVGHKLILVQNHHFRRAVLLVHELWVNVASRSNTK